MAGTNLLKSICLEQDVSSGYQMIPMFKAY